MNDYRKTFFERVLAEVERAYKKHGSDQWGRHEFWGVFDEEVDELKDAIRGDLPQEEVEKEMIQVAAMMLRYFETRDRYREPNEDFRALSTLREENERLRERMKRWAEMICEVRSGKIDELLPDGKTVQKEAQDFLARLSRPDKEVRG